MIHLRAPRCTWPGVPPQARAGMCSVLLHAVAVTLMFTLASSNAGRRIPRDSVRLASALDLAPYLPHMASGLKGGGGGGDRSPRPASPGRLPRFARRQFTPPAAAPNNPRPILPMEPTLIVPPELKLSEVNLPQFGDPFAKPGPPSSGPGCCGGIGDGRGHGVGSGDGPGLGPGKGGGVQGPPPRPAGALSGLVVLYKVEPDYSDDARKAQLQGVVIVRLEVDESGMPRNLTVVRSLGLGLDERAVEAVGKWRFRPAYRNGKPTVAAALVEVNFRLL
ncbi:MAG: energy transducer TonB [Bryobacteraceae bacterium]